ncbi:hypothetical protein SUFG_00064 [Sulfitobacter phage phiCB2047-B]|uniref:Uncharacterized protein n=1 Tax=Sulfitobacter phage phiCB2047-B TaxID=754046 RepID=M4PRQ3_9CAUD|nr:hypothetical protein SUFG_00064 [Sulfitobacter phage phiCB2047-B]AGH07431.1 hypothetical protein SUFG_00064 [Sulfitobacter phage phiCB2047-B]
MKFSVFVILIGMDSCNGGLSYVHYYEDVVNQEDCIRIAEEYSELEFVHKAECTITHIKEVK